MKTFIQSLVKIQGELKAPKNQFNSFGKYKYRNCEDILEAVKPLLLAESLLCTVTDEVVMKGDRYYVKATAILTDGEHTLSTNAEAREEEQKKGMDGAQVTGAASSYARKYALNGLFLIDDTKDADSEDNTKVVPPKVILPKEPVKVNYISRIEDIKTVDEYKSLKDELSKNWLSIEESIRDIIAQKMEDKKQILNIS